jgi:hypothetical protein
MGDSNTPTLPSPPQTAGVTAYDREHAALYLRLLDAEKASATPEDMAVTLFGGREAAHLVAVDTHLARAHYLCRNGFLGLLH